MPVVGWITCCRSKLDEEQPQFGLFFFCHLLQYDPRANEHNPEMVEHSFRAQFAISTKRKTPDSEESSVSGGPPGNRTPNPLIKSQML